MSITYNSSTTAPGYAAKQAEYRKFCADQASASSACIAHGGPHVLVPIAIENGGRIGANAQVFLLELARRPMAPELQNMVFLVPLCT